MAGGTYIGNVLIPNSNADAFNSLGQYGNPNTISPASTGDYGPTSTTGGDGIQTVTVPPSGGSAGSPGTGGATSGDTGGQPSTTAGSGGGLFSALSPSAWLSAIGSWLAAGSSRVVLIILGILLVIGAMMLFAAREAEGVSPVKP